MKTTNHTLSAAFALTLALGLTSCSDDDSPEAEPPVNSQDVDKPAETGSATDSSTESESESTTAGDDEAEDTSADDGSSTAADGLTAIALDAIATAEAETGGVAYEIDDQDSDGTWEVDVRVDDRSIEVTVSSDGSEVVSTEDDNLDDDDREALDAAGVTLTHAIETAVDGVGGVLDDAELETTAGEHAWEVSMDTGDQHKTKVFVSVKTGEILSTHS